MLADYKIPIVQHTQIESLESEGKTVMLLATEEIMIGMIAVADTVKKDSYEAIKQFVAM